MQSQGRRLDIGSQDVDSSRECDSKIRLEEGFDFILLFIYNGRLKIIYTYCTVSLKLLKTHIYPMFTYLLYYFRFASI